MTDLATLEIKLVTSGKDESIQVLSNVKAKGKEAKSAISDLNSEWEKLAKEIKHIVNEYNAYTSATRNKLNADREYVAMYTALLKEREALEKKYEKEVAEEHLARIKNQQAIDKAETSAYEENIKRKLALEKKYEKEVAEEHLARIKYRTQAQAEADKAAKSPYQTLGIQSKADIEQQKRAIVDAYNKITSTAEFSAREQAKLMQLRNQKLKALDNDMVKSHETSWASMTRAVLRWYAAFFVISAAVDGVMRVGKAIFDAGKNAMQTEKAFQEITGSAQEANKEFAFLRDLADRLGQNFWELQDAYKGVLAASKTTNLTAIETRGIFESLIKATTTLGLSSDRTKYVLYALQQMMSKGKVSTEELRRQMGESLYGAFGLAAKAMGMTAEAFDKALSNGEIYTDEFLPKFKKVLDDTYSGTVVDAVAVTNKWNEAVTDLQVSMAKGGFIEHVAEAIKKFTEIIKDRSFIESLSGLADILGKVVLGFAYLLERVGHMGVWAHDIGAAFGLVSAGVISFSDVASMNFEELNGLIRRFNDDPELTILEERAKALKKQIESIKETTGTTDINADIFKFIGNDLGLSSAVSELADIEKKLTNIKELKFKEFANTIGADLVNPLMQLELQAKDTEKALKDMLASAKPKAEDTKAINELIESLKLERIELLGGKRAVLEKTLADATDNVETQRMVLLLFDKNEALRTSLKSTEDATKEAEKQVETTKNYIDNLEQEIEAIGRSAEATEILKARHAGLTKTRLAEIEVMIKQKHAMLDLRKKAEEDTEAIAKNIEEGAKMASDSDRAAREKRKKEEEDALKKQEEDYKHYLERIQDATADAFYDIFAGNVDGWDDMLSRMGDLLMRYLAEWAAQALLKPVIIPVIQSVTGGIFGGVTQTGDSGSNGATNTLLQYGGNYVGDQLGITNTISSLLGYNFGSSGTTSMVQGINGMTQVSNVGSGFSFTLGDALSYYGLGSLGYSTIGDWIGLPQSEYSGMAAGAGASLGGYGGAALGTGSGILAGTAYGSYLGPIGAVIGAILGGLLGSVFGGQEDKKYVDLKNMPNMTESWGYGQTPGFASFDIDQWKSGINNVGYDNLNDYDKGLSDMMFAAVTEGLAPLVQGVYDTVDDMLAQMPEDLAADIKTDLVGLGDVFSMEGISKHILRNRGGDRAQLDIERILTETSDMMLEQIIPVFENNVSTYIQGMIKDASGTLSMLDSKHMLSKFIGNDSIFNEDFSRAEGASFEDYAKNSGEFLDAITQIQAAWDSVTTAFDLAINPLSEFEVGLQNVQTQVDGAIQALKNLGFNEESLTEAREKGTEVVEAYIQAELKKFRDPLQDQYNRLTMSDSDYARSGVQADYLGRWESLNYMKDSISPEEYQQTADLIVAIRNLELATITNSEIEAQLAKQKEETEAAVAKSLADLSTATGIRDTLTDRIQGLTMDPFEKQRIDAMAEVFDLNSQIIALPKEWHYLLDLTNEWLDLTLNGIKEAQAEQLKSAAIAEIQANITYLEGEQAKIEQALADAKSLYIDALNREISALQEAQDKLQAAYDTAKSLYSDALNREISALQAKQTELENNAESAKSDYIDAIKREIDAIKREIDAKKEAIGVTENLSDEWADLAKTIKETRDSLFLGAESALNPGQKTSFAGSQFQGAMQGIFAGDYEQAKNIPGYAQDYLSAARGATANRHEYANIFGQVQAQLATAASIAESKGIKATDEQIAENTAMSSMSLSELEALLATLVPAELTLAEAQQKYQEAQLALDSSNYQVEIALLEKELAALNGEVLTLSQAQLKYNEAKTALDLSTYDAQIEYYQEALDEFDEIIRLDDARNAYLRAQNDFDRASYQTDLAYWNQELNLLQAINAGIQTIATSEYNAFVGTPTGFADGGIATGPASGHWELLHGDELVVPLNNIRGSSTRSSGDDEEIKALLRELIALNRGNTEYSRKLYRVLDRVTGGENSLQTRAA